MTLRLDLTKRRDLMPCSHRVLISPTPFGCADCGRWFQFARELLLHPCEAREPVTRGPGCSNPGWERGGD